MNIKVPILIFLFILFAACTTSSAQVKPVLSLKEEDGLANNYIRDITKDNRGNLWIATENGLSKYYGSSFHNFYKSDGLPNNRVWALAAGEGVVYAGCYLGGIAEIRNDEVTCIYRLSDPKFKNSFRKLFYSKHYHLLLAGTDYGVFVLKDTTLIPVKFDMKDGQKHSILSFSEYGSRIFFTVHGGNGGLYEMFVNTASDTPYTAERLNEKGVYASTVIKDTLYFTLHSKVYAYALPDVTRLIKVSDTDGKSIIWDMASVGDSLLVMSCYNEGKFKNTSLKLNVRNGRLSINPDHLPAVSSESVFYDRQNDILWYGTGCGVFCSFRSPFTSFPVKGTNAILDIVMHNDSLMALTKDMIYYFNGREMEPVIGKKKVVSELMKAWKRDAKINKIDISRELKDPVSDLNLSFLQNDGGKLFVRTIRGGISVPDTKTYYPFYYNVFKSVSDGIYVQMPYRYLRFYPSLKNLHTFQTVKGDRGELRSVFEIIESSGILYFASYFDGIYAIKNKKVHYLNNRINSDFEDQLTDIAKDKDGRVWCISSGGSLMQVELENDSLVLKKRTGVSNSGILGESYKWLIFNDDYLYLATNRGLNVISYPHINSDSVTVDYFFNKYNGYGYMSATDPVLASNGDVFVHTDHELIRISERFYSPRIKGIEFENVFVNTARSGIENIRDKELPYSTSRISFTFNVIKYPTAKNVVYRYKLNDGEWINDNHVLLQALRDGEYTILMEARNLETDTKYASKMQFVVIKPFWYTWWFVFYLVLLVIFIVVWIFRIREMRLRKYHEEKTDLLIHNSNLKLRSLQLQMNPHFIFNSLTSIQGFILMESGDKAMRFIDDLAIILRTSLENASEDYILLKDEIEFLKTYAEMEQFRYGKKLEVNFINELEDEADVFIPPMLVQPLIENAIKHGIAGLKTQGVITVRFYNDSGVFTISVKDNGIGRTASKKNRSANHTGKALSILKERLALLNEKNKTDIHRIRFIDLEQDGEPLGTEVVITLLFVKEKDT